MIYRLSSLIFIFTVFIHTDQSIASEKSIEAIIKEADEMYYSSGKYYGHPDSLLHYADKIKSISKEIDYKKGYINGSFLAGMAYNEMKVFDQAAKELYQGLNLIQENYSPDLQKKQMIFFQLLAATYDETYNYSNSIEMNKKALIIAHELQDTVYLGELYFNLGTAYYHAEKYPEAKSTLKEALNYMKIINNDTYISRAYNSIGLIYQKKEEYSVAIKYFEKALKTAPKNSTEKTWYLSNIGLCYEKNLDYQKAIEYYNTAFQVTENIQDDEKESWILNNLGEIHLAMKDYSKAISYFQKSLSLVKEIDGYNQEYARANKQIANTYYAIGDYKKASIFKDNYISQTTILQQTNESLYEQISKFRMREIEWELERQKQVNQIHNLNTTNFWFKISILLLFVILSLATYNALRFYLGIRAVKKWIASE